MTQSWRKKTGAQSVTQLLSDGLKFAQNAKLNLKLENYTVSPRGIVGNYSAYFICVRLNLNTSLMSIICQNLSCIWKPALSK